MVAVHHQEIAPLRRASAPGQILRKGTYLTGLLEVERPQVTPLGPQKITQRAQVG